MNASRDRIIVGVSCVGIVSNVVLALAKFVIGFVTHSIAFTLDAVNSITDAFASVVTIIGARLASMNPTRKHPFGYGRIEHVTSIIIAAIVLAAGITSMRESIVRILHPQTPTYTTIALVVMTATAIAKLALGLYTRKRGKAIDAQPLIGSGIDSLYDAVLTTCTVVSALVFMASGVDIDGWVGAIVSVFIIKSGLGILREALSTIIGVRPSEELVSDITNTIAAHPEVKGVCDIFLDSFGSNCCMGSAHIEVDDDMSARCIHALVRTITEELAQTYNVTMTIGIYASNSTSECTHIREHLMDLVESHPEILQIHGFYVDPTTHEIHFDLVVDFHVDVNLVEREVVDVMRKAYPDYRFNVVIDADIS